MGLTASPPVFRFAPSPNGLLHLGHAYSAILNFEMAKAAGGRFLIRVEDIDLQRCRPELEKAMLRDLEWLGLEWETPVRRQSEHFDDYAEALQALADEGLVYKSSLSRGDVRRIVEAAEQAGDEWPRDPDGAPLFPGRDYEDRATGEAPVTRLDMGAALSHAANTAGYDETGIGAGYTPVDPARWGDVVLSRRDAPTSYHMAVVVDDAIQGVTHVVRGRDLKAATDVHVLLQDLLGLPRPTYYHHALIEDDAGRKLSKSNGDTSLAALREAGTTPLDIRRLIGLS